MGSETQTPKLSKVLISGVSFYHRSLPQSHESDVLSLFSMQNSQKFPGFFSSLDPTGEGLQHPPDYPASQRFFSSLHLPKNWHPPKIAGYGTGFHSLPHVFSVIFGGCRKRTEMIQNNIAGRELSEFYRSFFGKSENLNIFIF